MKVLNRSLFIFIAFFFLCCGHITDIKVKMAFNNSEFNTDLIQNLNNYSKLKDFLIENLDTIINYRKSVHIEQFIGDCSGFTIARGPYDTQHLPAFIYLKLDSLLVETKRNKLNYFTICKDSSIEFNFETTYPYNDVFVVERLAWNKKDDCKYVYAYSRDTLLGAKWRYDVCVDEDTDTGW